MHAAEHGHATAGILDPARHIDHPAVVDGEGGETDDVGAKAQRLIEHVIIGKPPRQTRRVDHHPVVEQVSRVGEANMMAGPPKDTGEQTDGQLLIA